jgi:hypothetical protein
MRACRGCDQRNHNFKLLAQVLVRQHAVLVEALSGIPHMDSASEHHPTDRKAKQRFAELLSRSRQLWQPTGRVAVPAFCDTAGGAAATVPGL